jgi:hypothetical protein
MILRRLRLVLDSALWRLTRPLRKPPAPVAGINAAIAAAARSHKPRAYLIKRRREIVHQMLREGIAR